MAVYKTGALVTDIVGSIGGTTFKRNNGTKVMMNKNFGGSYNKQLQNPQLPRIKEIFQAWRTLSSIDKADWSAAALTFTFPDKFGVLRNINGRQLFTKVNINVIYYGTISTSPLGITSVIPAVTLGTPVISIGARTATMAISSAGVPVLVLMQFEVSSQPLNAPVFNSRKVVFFGGAGAGSTADFADEFFAAFPNIVVSDNVRMYLTIMNNSGFKNPPIALDVTVNA